MSESKRSYYTKPVPLAELQRLAGLGLNWKQCCDALGFSEDTMKRRRDADPAIEAAFNCGRASTISAVANAVVERALAGCPQSQKLFMNTVGGWATSSKQELAIAAKPEFRLILMTESGEQQQMN